MKKTNVVVVDSSSVLLSEIRSFFENDQEYGVKTVYSLTEAEHIDDIEILVFDIALTMLESARALNKTNKLIALVKNTSDVIIDRAISLGAVALLQKPFAPSQLLEKLKQLETVQTFPVKSSKALDERLANIFLRAGIPPHIKGYRYLREAIKLSIEDPAIVNNITKRLYPTVAKHFDTSPSKVERAIRHAIEVAWSRGKIETINTLFGAKIYNKMEKPTNGEFIALIADKLLLEGL